MGEQVVAQLGALGDGPAQPDARQRPDLRHRARHDGFVIEVDRRSGEAVVVLGEQAVDLVAHEPGPVRAGDIHDRFDLFAREQGAGGVVGVVDADDFGVVGHQRGEFFGVDMVVRVFFQMEDVDGGAAHFGNRIELLVGGHDRHHVVARTAQGGKHQVVGAGRAVSGDDVAGLDGFVEVADAFEEGRVAFDVAVGEPTLGKVVHELGAVAAADLEELVERERVGAGLGDVVGAFGFPFVHPLLDGEVLDVHESPFLR